MHSQSSIDSEWGNESPPRISPSRKQITTPVRDALTRQVEQSTERRRRARRDKTVKASADSVTALYREESDQLVRDFNQILIRSNRDLTERLDLTVERHAKIHQDKLLQAAAEHDRVRQFAEREKLRVFLEEEQIRLKKEEQQQREIARLKQEKARQEEEARQRVLQQKLKEEEAARKAAEQAKQIRDAEARAKAEKEEALAAQKQKAEREEAERKAKEQAEKTKAQQAQVALPVTQAATVPIPVPSQSASSTQRSNAEREAVHQQYLDLHKRLKAYRDWMTTEGKKIPALKSLVGDSRRELRIKAGQITTDRNNSKATIFAIRQVLNKAKETGNLLSQDIRPFIISHPIPPLADESEAQFPALLLYLLHMFAKFILAQFISEAGKDDGKILQEIGLIAASIFADPVYTWNGIPLVDLMLAKYHRVCPVLFGIYGREDTVRGRERLGWLSVDGKSRSTNDHHQRMLGLSSGFAALTLRAFKNHPAIPMSAYWRAVAVVVDTPPADLTTTHMVVLKGLLRDYAAKFIEFYGGTALALLRASVIEVPKRAPPAATEGANLLKVLPDLWKRGLFLTVE
jgi:nucleoporin GLE1